MAYKVNDTHPVCRRFLQDGHPATYPPFVGRDWTFYFRVADSLSLRGMSPSTTSQERISRGDGICDVVPPIHSARRFLAHAESRDAPWMVSASALAARVASHQNKHIPRTYVL